jgi:hypothetical protein
LERFAGAVAKTLGLPAAMVNEEEVQEFLISLQMKLSKVCSLVQNLQAGCMLLSDVIDVNLRPKPEQIQQFFMVMEIYGSGTELSLQHSESDNLIVLRKKSLSVLAEIQTKLDKKILKLTALFQASEQVVKENVPANASEK